VLQASLLLLLLARPPPRHSSLLLDRLRLFKIRFRADTQFEFLNKQNKVASERTRQRARNQTRKRENPHENPKSPSAISRKRSHGAKHQDPPQEEGRQGKQREEVAQGQEVAQGREIAQGQETHDRVHDLLQGDTTRCRRGQPWLYFQGS